MTAILIFLKAPTKGQVKTRLAQTIGDAEAVAVYRALVERQLHNIPNNCTVEVHYSPPENLESFRSWLGHDYDYYPQCSGSLTERLTHACINAFKRGYSRVFCIGGDCPQLDIAHFEEAIADLNTAEDVVFGPTEDGGYYLVGMSAPHVKLFQGIPWSSEDTLKASLAQAKCLDLKIHQLDTCYDVDTIHELKRAQADQLLD
jgi:rSAM/selenodomain-associated transferase 1